MNIQKDRELLRPLVDKLLELSLRPLEPVKKKMWADHQALKGFKQIPVTVFYEGIPAPQWDFILGLNYLKCGSDQARALEFDLRKRIWIADNVKDDHIAWPFITIGEIILKQAEWGVPIKWEGSDGTSANKLEAKKIIAPFKDGIDLSRLKFTDFEIDEAATALAVEETTELINDKLPVFVHHASLGYSPFDKAVEFRGLENILYDVVDCPEKVHALMDYILGAYEKHHKNRENKNRINCSTIDGKYTAPGMRVNSAYLAGDFNREKLRLKDEWAYISAQTSSGLGPAMYEEFVQPYNVRLAKYFTNKTVYYHGCEPLDQKLDIISGLPNLRRFHVSPWSNVRMAAEKFKGSVVLEVHAHPGRVFFGFTRKDMKQDIKRLISEAGGVPMDLNLSDIHSINNDPGLLSMWAEAVKEAIEESKR